MKIIIAGNAKEYLRYLKENNLKLKDARYACRLEHILGYRNVEVIYVGTGATQNPLSGDPYLKLIRKKKLVRCKLSLHFPKQTNVVSMGKVPVQIWFSFV